MHIIICYSSKFYNQNNVPDTVLISILSYLQPQSFLPVAHVSKQFRLMWIEMKNTLKRGMNGDGDCDGDETSSSFMYETNPLAIGNLYERSWCQEIARGNESIINALNMNLLSYYVQCGFGSIRGQEDDRSANNESSIVLRKVMLETAARGDIDGMWLMAKREYFQLNDEEICTMAGAAGHLVALKWLRGDCSSRDIVGPYLYAHEKVCCPWDPTEVRQEILKPNRNRSTLTHFVTASIGTQRSS